VPEAKTHADLYHRHGDADSTRWVEGQAVTGREADPVPRNTSFADRAKRGSAENKQVQASEAKSLDDMTKDELIDEADRRGVEVAKSWTKGEILDALNG
jgi:crotonobetainyl-CoA:carnitine CoA-transferase CaiB-like acyl-CoA transferase